MSLRPFFPLLLPVVLLLAGCDMFSGAKLTNANLDQVHNGMTDTQVESILGKPTRIETGETLGIRGTTFYYQKGGADVQIVFLNNGVMIKQGTFK